MHLTKHTKRRIFQTLRFTLSIGAILFLTIWLANFYVVYKSFDYIYNDIDQIPYNNTALVLGTSKTLQNGMPNPYFTKRIQGASDLYHQGKIKYILVSGDNRFENYNEPLDMQQALVDKGVDLKDIYLDYAGLRTLDSVYRAKHIFGQDSFTIVSQEFHNQRAIYIAQYLGIDAIAFNVQDVHSKFGYKTMLREKLARVKVIIDQFLNVKPKHLGTPVTIGA